MIKLSELPRNSSKVRYRNRCEITGRPRAYHGYFGISRIMLRKLASQGRIPGLKKSSW
jgi:small subunit ribosomal protein S14